MALRHVILAVVVGIAIGTIAFAQGASNSDSFLIGVAGMVGFTIGMYANEILG